MRFSGIAIGGALALSLAGSAGAQVSAPLLGWLPEDTQIRPMKGLPGAATLGPVVNTGHRLANIAVSPSQNYVLAEDAQSGEVLSIVPGASATALSVPAKPDRIATSPKGSSAILWYSAAGEFEIVSGLPSNPAAREVATTLGGPVASIAVSDDGLWFAAASTSGVYEWGSSGVPVQVYGGGDAGALAFYAGNSDLAIATSTQVLAFDGSSTAALYHGSFTPEGLAVSFDNQKVVLADQSGSIYSIPAAGSPSMANCQCQPDGVFGLGGAVFRLTSSAIGPIKLIDANANAVLAVPRVTVRPSRQVAAAHPAQSSTGLPDFTLTVSPTPSGYLQQPGITVTASSPATQQINGNVIITFTTAESMTDDTIVFANGLNQVNFVIPQGSTQALFEGSLPSITFSTGSTAGTIALAVNITAPTAASSVATASYTNTTAPPVITGVTLAQSPGGVIITITGYSSSLDVSSATFNFNLTSNASITTNNITVNVSTQFQAWYSDSVAVATGSTFVCQVPFAISGNPADITSVSVFLLNSIGTSPSVTSN